MSLESKLVTALSGICPRVRPDWAEDDVALPFITFSRLGGSLINPISNVLPDKSNMFVQINVYSRDRAETVTMIKQVHDTLFVASTFTARANGGPRWDFDSDSGLRWASQDFSIWGVDA